MTSIYTKKIYLDITPSAPPHDDEEQAYRLIKIDEVERFLRDEVSYKESLLSSANVGLPPLCSASDTVVITSTTALEVASIATLTTGVGLPISIVLASTGLLLELGSAIVHKTEKMFNSKAKKHDKSRLWQSPSLTLFQL